MSDEFGNTVDITAIVRGVVRERSAESELAARAALMSAWRTTKLRAQQWAALYFPVRTGRLMGSVVASIQQSMYPYINVTSPVEYAPYVEAMEGVNWTNPMTVEHPFQALYVRVVKWFKSLIVAEFRRNIQLRGVTITKIKVEEGSEFGAGLRHLFRRLFGRG